jgi:hypothetical protein
MDQILTTTMEMVNIAPLGSGMVHGLSVALYVSNRVYEGEAYALAANVSEGGGSLLHCQGVHHGQEEG